MITTFYPPYSFGGDATYVRGLSRALVARGHEVDVIHCLDAYKLQHRGPLPDEPNTDDGVRTHRLHSALGAVSPLLTQQTGQPATKTAAIKRILGENKYDVVHFHNISLVGGPGIIKYSSSPVTLYTTHEHWLVCPTHILWKNRSHACDSRTCLSCCLRSGTPPQLWRYGDLIERSLEHVDQMISPSQFTADQHRAAGITRPIEVVPLFSAFEPPKVSIARNERQFLFVGRIVRPKGLEPLLKAFSRMPGMELLVIGDGDQRVQLEKSYAENKNIRFLGLVQQQDLAKHYSAATALIYPSLTPETFGLSIIEAAACGTPALVRAGCGGSPEIVAKTGGGMVYRDEADLMSIVTRMAEDPAWCSRLGALAREGYERDFTMESHLDRYQALIARVQARQAKDPQAEEVGL